MCKEYLRNTAYHTIYIHDVSKATVSSSGDQVCLPEEGGSSLRNVVNVCSVVYSVLRQREILSYLPVMCYMLLRCQEIVLYKFKKHANR